MKQTRFIGKGFQTEMKFGGSLLKGNARGKRPLHTKLPLHTVLRAKTSSLRKPVVYRQVNLAVVNAGKKYGLTIYEYANVGNHIHMLMRVPNRHLWGRFIREITGRIAQLVQGLKGRQTGERFWMHKPFTRVVAGWGRAYRVMKDYLFLNQMEGEGNIRRSEIPTFKAFREIFAEDW